MKRQSSIKNTDYNRTTCSLIRQYENMNLSVANKIKREGKQVGSDYICYVFTAKYFCGR